MRIVYNLRDQDWVTTKSLGILHVSTRLLRALVAQPTITRLDVLANRSLARELAPLAEHSTCRLHFAASPAPRRWPRLLWDNWGVARVCDQLQPDWLLLPKGFAPLIRWPRCRVSAYVHDNIFGYYSALNERPFPRGESALFQCMLRQTAKRAAVVVTNSEFTAEEFRQSFTPCGQVTRIGAPVALGSRDRPPVQVEGTTLLVPTSAWPHKLTRQAIAWLQRWLETSAFAGKIEAYGTLPPTVQWPTDARWVHHGRIGAEKLGELEGRAAVLIYFSAYEGYGLPPIEALAAGRRAIASDLPPLRETLPEACLFRNDDYLSFARTLSDAIVATPPRPLRVDTPTEVAAAWCDALVRAHPQ